jgi:hypothetical protein
METMIYSGQDSPVQQGFRNGLEEQTALLSRLSVELDEYFAMRGMRE